MPNCGPNTSPRKCLLLPFSNFKDCLSRLLTAYAQCDRITEAFALRIDSQAGVVSGRGACDVLQHQRLIRHNNARRDVGLQLLALQR